MAALASYTQELLLILFAILAFISLIVAIATYTASAGSSPEPSALTAEQQESMTPAERMETAETSTDENGIVHGTTADGISFVIRGSGESSHEEGKVSFAAVGDQIATDYSLEPADSYAGEIGDGEYDFKPFYQEVKPFIEGTDLTYINQETVLIGGQEGYPVSGYPTFVSPDACAEAIADTGFDLVNFTTNHSYDAGAEGIEYSQEVWERYPQLTVGGSYKDQAGRETVQMVERDGIRFAFLAYTYGDNTYENPKDEPNSYYAVAFDKDSAQADIERAKKVADCVIVSMHWGEEYTSEPTDTQRDWAQWLANQGVDLVIGTHAHNIQPVEYFTGQGGKRVPVVFGLGDFVSGWTITDTILSGIFTCDFVRQDDGIAVENLKWHPTIEWSDGTGKLYVRMLENMSVADINANTRTEDVPNSFAYLYETTNSIITQIPVEWGSDAEDKAKAAEGGEDASADAGAADATADSTVDAGGQADASGAADAVAVVDDGEAVDTGEIYYDYTYDDYADDGYVEEDYTADDYVYEDYSYDYADEEY